MHTPHFLAGRHQFTESEINLDAVFCSKRYTSEVYYTRVTDERSLYGVIRRELFAHVQSIVHWAHARANLYRPLQPPSGFPEGYFDEDPSQCHRDAEEIWRAQVADASTS